MNRGLLQVSLRQRALYLPQVVPQAKATPATLALVEEMHRLGFAFSEELLHAVNALSTDEQQEVLEVINTVMGTQLNWASLTRGWLTPTGESLWDHFLTAIANAMNLQDEIPGTKLPCGHFIPDGTFPLERYNGCPFCGTPFHTANFIYKGQGNTRRVLQLWGDKEISGLFQDLLLSPVALDATQRESLKTLLLNGYLDEALTLSGKIRMKETRMLLIDALVEVGRDDEATPLFSSPADVLRYLWYRHTGKVQVLQPRTLLNTARKNHYYEWNTPELVATHMAGEKEKLKLKYSRPWCRRVARWLNGIVSKTALAQPECPENPECPECPDTLPHGGLNALLEQMHARRGMWVRFIRALRLSEYARKPEYAGLRILLDRFYREDYEVWQGQVDRCRRERNAETTLQLLQQRPGLFARSLFATMLHFGPAPVISAFQEVSDRVPLRLLLTLGAQAELYFDPHQQRVVRPLSGVMKSIPPHPLLNNYTAEQLKGMQQAVGQLYLDAMQRHFSKENIQQGRTIFIDPQLFNIPVSVGDRSATVQDISAALQGTRFPIEGDHVRLFMQWGKDLPAQHLDMDLSCYILTDSETISCAYFNLDVPGAKHSGDIQRIPDQVGTAEYIELSLPELTAAGARRVVFTCNAYTRGALATNLMVGWMTAEAPMSVSDETGVAYDPSTVQHMVRITENNLTKGLIFGVLEVEQREIVWLEMPFDGQTVQSINTETVDAYLRRLAAKPTIGQVLQLKARAQQLQSVKTADEADEAYTLFWAQQTTKVSRLLLGS